MPNPPSMASPAAPPAYASAPRRGGWLVALLAVAALGAAAGAWWLAANGPARWFAPDPSPEPRSSAPEARSIEAAKAAIDKPLVEPVKPLTPAPEGESAKVPSDVKGAEGVPSAVALPSPAAPTNVPAVVVPSAMPPSNPPAHEAASATASRAEPTKPVPRTVPAAPAASVSSPPGAGTKAGAPPSPGSAIAPPAVSDRWDELHRELARCTRDSLIPRIACEQRLRASYCDGYWGRVPDCPSGRQDHGN